MAWLNTPRSTWIALAVSVVLVGATWYPGLEERFRQHKPMTIAEVGQRPNLNITLKDLDGKDVSLSSFAGKILIVNFYATWCGPCRVEMPDLVALQKAHADDVAVVGILRMDEDGDAKAFAQEYGVTYPLLNGNRRDDLDNVLGPIDGLPRSVVIGRDGVIAAIHEGATLRPTFERDLAKLR